MEYVNKLNKISGAIIDAAIEVHKNLGPGLLESIYETCLIKELKIRGFHSESQVIQPVYYNGEKLDKNFNIDLIVENEVIVELKTVEKILPIHKAHAMTYLKLSGKKLGVMINFNVPLLVQGFKGFKRVLNGQFPK
ncbi:MAG: GxxExxY protein [Ignavibacteria bacterium]|nr:GxxExxY protein [Ignavibacteria bacterium]